MKRIFVLIALIQIFSSVLSQSTIISSEYIYYDMKEESKDAVIQTLDSLYQQLSIGKLDKRYVSKTTSDLTISTLEKIQYYESQKDSSVHHIVDKQLINIYPISSNKYFLSIACYSVKTERDPIIISILNLIAENNGGKVTFSIPLNYLTRYWKKTRIGNIAYYHRGELRRERAEIFNYKNMQIAKSLGTEPEEFDFYMCENQQEMMKLRGFEFSIWDNGQTRNGYGIDANTIFAIQNNEDFSHDTFHYYSGKLHERKDRNWVAEEGIAYLWGNAYYTDQEGEMISLERLVRELKIYLKNNPDSSLLDLFENNPKVFDNIAPEVSVRSTISGVIAKKIEEKKGMDGIVNLINCGRKDKAKKYLETTDTLIGINRKNFDKKVMNLLMEY